jgi:phage terminase small subunit
MTRKGDSSHPFQIVPPGGGDGGIPGHWPECPEYLSVAQRARFYGVCRRLDEQGTLESADVGDIEALAIAENNLELITSAVNAGGRYVTVVKQGRPYQCPTCKGSGVRPLPKGAQDPPASAASPADHRRPGRPCSICGSPRLEEIDAALGRGASVNGTAKRFAVSPDARRRHKRDHAGRPSRPVASGPSDRTCLFCGGRGGMFPETHEQLLKHPGVADQGKAIDQVSKISSQLGLDVTSRVRVKGKPGERRGPSALQQLVGRRGPRK